MEWETFRACWGVAESRDPRRMVLPPPPRSRSQQEDAEGPPAELPRAGREGRPSLAPPPGGGGAERAGGQAGEGTLQSITVRSFTKYE